MNIKSVLDDQLDQLKPPPDWESMLCEGNAEEIDAAKRAADTASALHERIEAERESINAWIWHTLNSGFGQVIRAIEGEHRSDFSVEYFHHGQVEEGERVGLGLTSVFETDWNVVEGHRYPLRFELGWHEREHPLVDGLFYRDGYSGSDANTSGIRVIDPETGTQTGLWLSRVGGARLDDEGQDEPRPTSHVRRFLGSFALYDKNDFPENEDFMVGKGVIIEDGKARPTQLGKRRPDHREIEHLLGLDGGYIEDRRRMVEARRGSR